MDRTQLRAWLTTGHREGRRCAATFADAIVRGDSNLLQETVRAIGLCRSPGAWNCAMLLIAALPDELTIDERGQQALADIWHDDHIDLKSRIKTGVIVRALRRVLPKYQGPAITVYRGQFCYLHNEGSIGVSWTSDIDVARGFADNETSRSWEDGTVLLKAIAPPEAIICDMKPYGDYYGEDEYLIDPARLPSIEVIERFAHMPLKADQ